MKRRSFISLMFATLLPTSLISNAVPAASNTLNIGAFVEDEYAPYTVHGTIKNESTGVVTTINKTVTSGGYSKAVTYKAGQPLTMIMEVTASRSGSPNGYLSINDTVAKIRTDQRVTVFASA